MTLHRDITGPDGADTIVFLHGLGVSSWMWIDQVAALSDEFRCVTIDLPGNGRSHRQEWVSMSDSADRVAELIRRVAPEGAHLVGLSLGGYVALKLADRHPDIVLSIIASGVTATPMRPRLLYKALMLATAPLTRWRPLVSLMARAMRLPADARRAYVADAALVSKRTYSRTYEELLDHRAPDDVHRLLVVAGDREVKVIRNGLASFGALSPSATVVVAPRSHHAWNAEHPELFTAMIRSHVRAEPLPASLVPVPAPV